MPHKEDERYIPRNGVLPYEPEKLAPPIPVPAPTVNLPTGGPGLPLAMPQDKLYGESTLGVPKGGPTPFSLPTARKQGTKRGVIPEYTPTPQHPVQLPLGGEIKGDTEAQSFTNPLAGLFKGQFKQSSFLNDLVKTFQTVGGQALQNFNANQRVAAERNAQLLDPTNPNNPANIKIRAEQLKESNATKADATKSFQGEIAKLLAARNKALESNTDPAAATSINSQYADTLDELKKSYATTLGEDNPILQNLPDFEKLTIPRTSRKRLATATPE